MNIFVFALMCLCQLVLPTAAAVTISSTAGTFFLCTCLFNCNSLIAAAISAVVAFAVPLGFAAYRRSHSLAPDGTF